MIRETDNVLLADRPQKSYNRWLALLVVLFLILTIVFIALYAVEKGKVATTTTAAPPGPTTTPVTGPTTTTGTGPTTTTGTGPTTTTGTGPTTNATGPTTTTGTGPTTTTSAGEDLCLTPYCIKAADYLLQSIDPTVDPCEDFYHFACGTWLKNARIPEETGVQNIFNLLDDQLDLNIIDLLSNPPDNTTVVPKAVDNAIVLYDSCMDETGIEADGVEPVLSILENEFGGWPILLGNSWDPTTFNLTNLLVRLRAYDDGILYSVSTNTNQENSSVYDIELAQGDLGLTDKDYYINDTDVNLAYRQFMNDLATVLANDTSAIVKDVADMYAFEKEISQYHWNGAEQHLRDNETIRTTIGNLSESFESIFNFTTFLRDAYLIGGITLDDSDVVLVSEVAYLVNVSDILHTFDVRVVQNYLIWRFMMNRASSMPRKVRSTREQFDRVFKGTTAEPTRSTTCSNYVNDNMGFAVSRLYVQKYFDDNARNQSRDIIANIRVSMINLINNASWMDDDSKAKAVDKEQAIYENIGYPDFIVGDNITQLEKLYEGYVFNRSYIDNVLLMQRVKAQENFRQLREVVDHRAWGDLPPTVVNAFYEPSTNAISFPAGILQTPYFNKDAPKYLNYGGIGMVIGHEITHGFDDDGRQYDKDGNRVPWWSNSTIAQFNQRKQCIIDQYSNYTVEQIHKNLNGDQTQGENIADNGGIKSSFYSYQRWAAENPNVDKLLPGLAQYSQEKMFFIGYAHGWCAKFTDAYALYRVLNDVHSIPQFRVLGPLSNFVEFDRVFGCTPGQGDSRVNKCAVW